MNKHVAEPTTAPRIREHQAAAIAALGGPQLPGFGKHRDNYLEVPEPDEAMA